MSKHGRIYINRRVMLSIGLSCTFSILFLIIDYDKSINKMLAVATLIFSILWVYKCWNNTYMLLCSMFIAYCNYSIAIGVYLDTSIRPLNLYYQITDEKKYGIGISLLFLAMMVLMILTPKLKRKSTNIAELFVQPKNMNKLYFYMLSVVFSIIIAVGYGSGNGARGHSSPLYEYAIILLIIMFYYSGGDKVKKKICTILTTIYVVRSFLNGTRVEALQCILVYILCNYKKGIKKQYIFGGMIVGFVLLSVVGKIRGNLGAIAHGIEDIWSIVISGKFTFDTCIHAYFPMLCMIDEFTTYSLPAATHFFTRFLGSVILGANRVPDGNLISYTRKHYFHNNGGVTIGFFYVWFSYFGAYIFSTIIYGLTKYINNSVERISDYKMCMIIYLIASVPRWYLYGPWSMTRGILLCLIAFLAFKFVDKFTKKSIG